MQSPDQDAPHDYNPQNELRRLNNRNGASLAISEKPPQKPLHPENHTLLGPRMERTFAANCSMLKRLPGKCAALSNIPLWTAASRVQQGMKST
jgi:hypothetical protein